MVKCVVAGLLDSSTKLDAKMEERAKLGLKLLQEWDFRHDYESKGAPIMEAWEF
jgi:hypothetical protein